MNLLRAFNQRLYDLVQPFRITRDEDMPWSYQKANQNGLPLRNDLGLMGVLPHIQPWQKMRRMDFFYKPPMPFRIKSGNVVKRWQLWEDQYPLLAPGAIIENKEVVTVGGRWTLPHILVDEAGPGFTQWEAYLGGRWVECFWRYHKTINVFGVKKRLSAYNGLRPDYAVGFHPDTWALRSDIGAWFPDISVSFVKEV